MTRPSRAFTLVEVVVSLGLVTVALAGAYAVFFSGRQVTEKGMEHLGRRSGVARLFEQCKRVLRVSQDVTRLDDGPVSRWLVTYQVLRSDGAGDVDTAVAEIRVSKATPATRASTAAIEVDFTDDLGSDSARRATYLFDDAAFDLRYAPPSGEPPRFRRKVVLTLTGGSRSGERPDVLEVATPFGEETIQLWDSAPAGGGTTS